MGRSSWAMSWFSRGHPKAYPHQRKESQSFQDTLSLSPKPKSYLKQKQMLNKPKNKKIKKRKKGEVYFIAASVAPWSVQWDIITLLTIYMLVSHSQAPVHICHKTWWFFKSAQACMTLGCSPQSFRHAYVLRVHKILAKQIMTKSSECPEFSHRFKERWMAYKMTGDVREWLQGFLLCSNIYMVGTDPWHQGPSWHSLGSLWGSFSGWGKLRLKCPQLLVLTPAEWEQSWATSTGGTGNVRDKAGWWEVA